LTAPARTAIFFATILLQVAAALFHAFTRLLLIRKRRSWHQ